MKTIKVGFALESVLPIAHHSETIGNRSILMTETIRTPGGRLAKVPIITGDSLRHGLRETAAYQYLDAAGIAQDEKLTESTLRLLFAGGHTRDMVQQVNLDQWRETVELCPALGLLGGCANNRIMEGRVNVESAIMICSETASWLPLWLVKWLDENGEGDLQSYRRQVTWEQRVRMDPTLSPAKRALLSADSRRAVEDRLKGSEEASKEVDALQRDATKSSMMPRTYQVAVRGALWYWSIQAKCDSPLMEDCFMSMLAGFCADMVVGGKRATGHGRLKPLTAANVQLRSLEEQTETFSISKDKIGDLFRRHCAERSDRIREWVSSVKA